MPRSPVTRLLTPRQQVIAGARGRRCRRDRGAALVAPGPSGVAWARVPAESLRRTRAASSVPRSARQRGAVVAQGLDHDARLAAVARLMQLLTSRRFSARERASPASPRRSCAARVPAGARSRARAASSVPRSARRRGAAVDVWPDRERGGPRPAAVAPTRSIRARRRSWGRTARRGSPVSRSCWSPRAASRRASGRRRDRRSHSRVRVVVVGVVWARALGISSVLTPHSQGPGHGSDGMGSVRSIRRPRWRSKMRRGQWA